jgi:hypothetical protein
MSLYCHEKCGSANCYKYLTDCTVAAESLSAPTISYTIFLYTHEKLRNVSSAAATFSELFCMKAYCLAITLSGYNYILNNS